MKTCTKCNTEKELTDYSINKRHSTGRNTVCKKCENQRIAEYRAPRREQERQRAANYRKQNKEKIRDKRLKEIYGISLTAYNTMYDKQKGVCKICHEPSNKTFAVDHCHTTGEVRGLLCSPCNTSLGLMKDNIQRLSNAIEYLKSTSA